MHINGIRLINNLFGPNNDGIDVTGCTNVMISDCYVETCDDAICLKTTDESNELHNVTVTNCTMRTTCVALKFSETSKNMGDVTFSNCVITHSSRAEGRILITVNDGCKIENITLRDIKLSYPYIEDPSLYGPFATSSQFEGMDSELF